jgi:hypothetical protein
MYTVGKGQLPPLRRQEALLCLSHHQQKHRKKAEIAPLLSQAGKPGICFRKPGMGLKFIAITPQDQECIRKFVRDEVMLDVTTALIRAEQLV